MSELGLSYVNQGAIVFRVLRKLFSLHFCADGDRTPVIFFRVGVALADFAIYFRGARFAAAPGDAPGNVTHRMWPHHSHWTHTRDDPHATIL